jgi:cephalosporin hydroxylase
MIIGEASFHQYHGGTTTNIDDDSKNSAVRGYFNAFYAERGRSLKHVAEDKLRYRGRMPLPDPLVARQRPMFPFFIGVTSRIRSADRFLHFDQAAADYLNSYVVEAGLPAKTTWFGLPTGVTAGDLLSIQDLVLKVRPTRIVTTNLAEGLLAYLAFVLEEAKVHSPRLICVGDSPLPQRPGVEVVGVSGPAASIAAQRAVRSAIAEAEDVLVIFHPDEDDSVPIGCLNAYMGFVSIGSYLVFTGTALGQPWLGYSRRWYRKAIQVLSGPDSEFRVDPAFENHVVTVCPSGYLRRVGKRQSELGHDASMDDLGTL